MKKRKKRLPVDQSAWQVGYKAGKTGQPIDIPPGLDEKDYLSGHAEGEADCEMAKHCRSLPDRLLLSVMGTH